MSALNEDILKLEEEEDYKKKHFILLIVNNVESCITLKFRFCTVEEYQFYSFQVRFMIFLPYIAMILFNLKCIVWQMKAIWSGVSLINSKDNAIVHHICPYYQSWEHTQTTQCHYWIITFKPSNCIHLFLQRKNRTSPTKVKVSATERVSTPNPLRNETSSWYICKEKVRLWEGWK